MSDTEVAIIDCGGANIASLTNALDRLGVTSVLTRDAGTICAANHVILPGVGAAADTMQRLEHDQLSQTITRLRQPVLGICLGMQLLADTSTEGNTRCLGIIPAAAEKLAASVVNPVPNMGWCRVTQKRSNRLLDGIDDGSYFYFVHSYALPLGDYTLATAEHANAFTAVLQRDNFYATQFHPERSAAAGAKLLKNFLEIDGCK